MYTYNIDWRFAYIPGIGNGHMISTAAYANAMKHSTSILCHVSALLIDNVLLAFSAHLCWPRKTFQVYCIVHLKHNFSVLLCICKTMSWLATSYTLVPCLWHVIHKLLLKFCLLLPTSIKPTNIKVCPTFCHLSCFLCIIEFCMNHTYIVV